MSRPFESLVNNIKTIGDFLSSPISSAFNYEKNEYYYTKSDNRDYPRLNPALVDRVYYYYFYSFERPYYLIVRIKDESDPEIRHFVTLDSIGEVVNMTITSNLQTFENSIKNSSLIPNNMKRRILKSLLDDQLIDMAIKVQTFYRRQYSLVLLDNYPVIRGFIPDPPRNESLPADALSRDRSSTIASINAFIDSVCP